LSGGERESLYERLLPHCGELEVKETPTSEIGSRRSAGPRPGRLAAGLVGTILFGLAVLATRQHDRPLTAPHHAVYALPVAAEAFSGDDADADGVPDSRENALAVRFAPIVVHHPAENVYPMGVDQFLQWTSLWLYDDACGPDLMARLGPVTQVTLFHTAGPTCGAVDPIDSYGVRSRGKQRTFFLEDVAPQYRGGDTERWPTYVHVYPNDRNGLTVQYWRFYAYNELLPYHGGDWEGFHVVLDSRDSVLELALIGHTDIAVRPPADFRWDSAGGLHPVVGVVLGGHTTIARVPPEGLRHRSSRAPLVNLGEKTRPMNGQLFLQYSGLWGSPGTFYQSSGYWGPAFNETAIRQDGFVVAWCRGTRNPERTVNGVRECYPSRESR
jgi:hypothetical protein